MLDPDVAHFPHRLEGTTLRENCGWKKSFQFYVALYNHSCVQVRIEKGLNFFKKEFAMKKLLMIAILCSSSAVFAKGGGAGVYLGLDLLYETQETTTTTSGVAGTPAKWGYTAYDLDAGYVMGNGLYLGATMANYTSDQDTFDPKMSIMGLSVGYMRSGFMLTAQYYLSGTWETATNTKYSNGSGIGVDIGYLWNVAGGFHLGGGLAYRSLEFKKLESGGVTIDNSSVKHTENKPRLIFAFIF